MPPVKPKENANGLKILVFSMGLLLIGGTLMVAGVVWKRATAGPEANTASSAQAANCPGGRINLKGRGVITDSSIDGQILHLTLVKQAGKSEIVTVDICTGKIIGTLVLETDDITGN